MALSPDVIEERLNHIVEQLAENKQTLREVLTETRMTNGRATRLEAKVIELQERLNAKDSACGVHLDETKHLRAHIGTLLDAAARDQGARDRAQEEEAKDRSIPISIWIWITVIAAVVSGVIDPLVSRFLK